MSHLVLIDTSAWTAALRKHGDAAARSRVEKLLTEQRAAWCEAVRLELWAGVRGAQERETLEDLDRTLPRVPITQAVWDTAVSYAGHGRATGLSVPAADLLIFACAKQFGLQLEHVDRHHDLLEQLHRENLGH
jgi:predicted nucleic acid-binding protein